MKTPNMYVLLETIYGSGFCKLLGWVCDGYDVMHLSMTYDGVQNKSVCDAGFELANEIIDRCAAMLAS